MTIIPTLKSGFSKKQFECTYQYCIKYNISFRTLHKVVTCL